MSKQFEEDDDFDAEFEGKKSDDEDEDLFPKKEKSDDIDDEDL